MIGSLFSGIGGLELGLEWAGLGPVAWQVEIEPYCRAVLARHWPDANRGVTDVRAAGGSNLAAVDVICGGFPCQDVSSAGKRAGLSGAKSGLWYECRRVIDEIRPAGLVIENVASGARRPGSRKSAPTSPTLAIERAPWALEPATLARLIGATGSSLSQWPTPLARCGSGRGVGSPETVLRRLSRGRGPMLEEAVEAARIWPTPTAQSRAQSARYPSTGTHHTGETLRDAVEWPTPTASGYGTGNNGCPGDGRESYATAGKPSLSASVKGPLNPAWIEALMGFPPDWTRIDTQLSLFGPPAEEPLNTPGNQPAP